MRRRLALLGFSSLVAASCALGPDYKRPPIVTPEEWRDAVTEATTIANIPWWELFQDEQLRQLIQIALAENKDLKIAVERIAEARALYGFTKADLFPKVGLSGAGGRLRFGEGSLTHTPEGDAPDGGAIETDIYALTADLSWEIDFFGRIRRATEAQFALLLGSEEARRSVVITLVADVARAYVELRSLDRLLEISRRTLESRREYVELARLRFAEGYTPELDWRQAEAEFHRVQVQVYEFERLVVQKENELSVLLGRNPAAVPRGRPADGLPVPPEVPAGLPSELLERRPDIREAEERLVATNARIGEAKAMLFPRISLTASFGYASTALEDWFVPSGRVWSVIGSLMQPIFEAGKNLRRIDVAESRQRQALYDYERTILQALRDVNDSLIAYRKAGEQIVSQRARVEAERKVLELSDLRYREGVAAYLEVLDAQRSLFGAEQDEVEGISSELTALIRLYKALGGGWQSEPPPAPPTPGTEPPTGPTAQTGTTLAVTPAASGAAPSP
jgi:multidrug efflux system outer membrane protein